MAQYSELIGEINDNVFQNAEGRITGDTLNAVLKMMVSSLGKGYQFLGFATPSTDPGAPDEKVFYVAVTPGTYSGFGGYVLGGNKIVFFTYSSSWSPTAVELSDGAVPVEELLPAAGLLPNVFYDIGVRSSALNVVLQAEADASSYNEYMLRFSIGDAIPLVSFPVDLIWPVDDDGNVLQPEFTANTTFEISIVRKHATWVKWKYTASQV